MVSGNAHDYGGKVGIDLSPYAKCWSDVIKSLDYSTGYIGKWHLDAPYRLLLKVTIIQWKVVIGMNGLLR